jgi:pantothenate kinase
MDGFHLRNAELIRLGRLERKGAPDTFDADGFAELLRRLREPGDIRAPEFDRSIEEPVADAILIPAAARIVLTEGNYLLLDDGPWAAIRPALDECWYVEVEESVRTERLVERHVQFGRTRAEALSRAQVGSDAANARLIEGTRSKADLVVQ